MTVVTICDECGEKYERVGGHWRYNPDHRPELTLTHCEVVTGLLMGDGYLERNGHTARLKVEMTSPNYLEYLDDLFGVLGTGVKLKETGEEKAKRNRESGHRPNACGEDYSDIYSWRTRAHPDLLDFDWYTSDGGDKVWPQNIDLTPRVLKHWYCGDGYWDNSSTCNRISIAMSNEVENTEKVSQMFENANLPKPINYNIREREWGGVGCEAQFSVDGSAELFAYMGESLPDFEYKFPDQYVV